MKHNALSLTVERVRKPYRPTIPERSFHKTVGEFLDRALPLDAYHTAIPGGDGGVTTHPAYRAGAPDHLICFQGRTYFLELKSAKGVVSEDQRASHKRLAWSGCEVLVARTETAIEAWLLAKGIPLRAKVSA